MKNDLETCAIRALDAWDTTVLPKANDGRMQECMEDLRLALADMQQPKRPQNCGTSNCSCIECVMEPTEVWRDDDPPKRGTYRVRRIGTASTNYGYAYWTGKGWGSICATWKWAQESKGLGRKTPSRYPMQWLKKTARRIKGDK